MGNKFYNGLKVGLAAGLIGLSAGCATPRQKVETVKSVPVEQKSSDKTDLENKVLGEKILRKTAALAESLSYKIAEKQESVLGIKYDGHPSFPEETTPGYLGVIAGGKNSQEDTDFDLNKSQQLALYFPHEKAIRFLKWNPQQTHFGEPLPIEINFMKALIGHEFGHFYIYGLIEKGEIKEPEMNSDLDRLGRKIAHEGICNYFRSVVSAKPLRLISVNELPKTMKDIENRKPIDPYLWGYWYAKSVLDKNLHEGIKYLTEHPPRENQLLILDYLQIRALEAIEAKE